MTSPRLFIVHGYTAGPHSHWFDWLKSRAEESGFSVRVPALPDSQRPQPQAWQDALAECVGVVDKHTWFVGHSLGCITILNYLSQLPASENAGGLILVSGFSESVPPLPELDPFISTQPDAERLKQVPQRAVIASLNDQIVPVELSLRLSQQLNAPFYGLPDGGHFLERDGFRELPLALALLPSFITE